MKKTILLCLLVIILAFEGRGEVLQTINLDALEIFEPQFMVVQNEMIFILDKTSGRIFRIEDREVTRTFGKRGEGPGEYKNPKSIGFYENCLWVSDVGGKVVFFTLDGQYIAHETMKLQDYQFNSLRAMLGEKKRIEASVLFDERGNMMKSFVYRHGLDRIILATVKTNLDAMLTGLLSFPDAKIAVGAEKCYIVEDDYVFRVKVFSLATGSFETEIVDSNYKPLPLQGEELAELKSMAEHFSERVSQKKSKDFKIPKHHKAIESIWSDEDDNLFLLGNERKDGKLRLRIYNSSLRLNKEIYVPKPHWAAFSNGRMYSIREDEYIFVMEIIDIL